MTAKPEKAAAAPKPAPEGDDAMQVEKGPEAILKASLELRFASRALRGTAVYRSLLTNDILKQAVQQHVLDAGLRTLLSAGLSVTLDASLKPATAIPEVELFVGLLTVIFLSDQKQFAKGITVATDLLQRVKQLNRRTLDPIGAKIVFFYAYFHDENKSSASIHSSIIAFLRTATLRQDNDTQATLLNIILKNYMSLNLIDQADKLVAKVVFPDTVGNNQISRYMYYLGRIKAIQLDYSESHRHLLQAIRKAPQTVATAGFQEAAHKLAVIVQLLMGEIPERTLFSQTNIRAALTPYLAITQAVRVGDLNKFQETLAKYGAVFQADKNMTLVLRLRHNVIKTGIRRISVSYSRISLKDVCLKLHLDSEEDAEYIAISDGVIDATIDHQKGTVQSNEIIDVYSTNEPQNAFHQRISFCLDLHNESIQAMRYPHNTSKKELAQAAERAAEERELASKIDEMDDDEDMM
ncbi:26S proteasome non-ATPase regulatory subunit [Kappamyces sp. JEL0680]|nr:26S proteasome non-ATPase regulatory subunit [Kappamyces sp. JEL0680]